jgi:hypothetical protein
MMKKLIFISILLFGVFLGAFSQEEQSLITPNLELKYYNINHSKKLVAFLNTRQKREIIPVSGASIVFYIGKDEPIKLGEVATRTDGSSTLVLDGLSSVQMDKAGSYNFSASFKGTKKIETADASISITEIDLDLMPEIVDSIKTIHIHARKIIPDTANNLLKEEAVNIYVSRMFSLLLISEETLDGKGDINLEFPVNIPGDKEGNVNVVAKIEDHEIYGNVEISKKINWGLPTNPDSSDKASWAEGAPLWMIIVLSIMLAGVWGNYIFSIIQLVIIHKLGKKKINNNIK